MEHQLPIMVFNYLKDGNIQRAVMGEKIGTRIGTMNAANGKRSLSGSSD
jgi:hypothetical protein